MTPPNRPTALGIDLGGTWVRAGLVTAGGQVSGLVRRPTPPAGEPRALVKTVAAAARDAAAGALPERVGIALPGIWDRSTTTMRAALNLQRLEGVNLRELFEAALRRRALFETDVNAAGWGHWAAWGTAGTTPTRTPRPRRFVYLALGTGVGGCVILNGRIVRHTRGGAGHFGHLIVDTRPSAPRCRCGAQGCLEAIAGGAALNRQLSERRHASQRQRRASQRRRPLTAPDVLAPVARALAVGLLQVANIYAPDVIALGGGVIEAHPDLVSRAAHALDELTCSLPPRDLVIERAALPADQAGVVGAGLLALAATPLV